MLFILPLTGTSSRCYGKEDKKQSKSRLILPQCALLAPSTAVLTQGQAKRQLLPGSFCSPASPGPHYAVSPLWFASQMWLRVGWKLEPGLLCFGSTRSREDSWVKCVLAPSMFPLCKCDGGGSRWRAAGLWALPGGCSLALQAKVRMVPVRGCCLSGVCHWRARTQPLGPCFTSG